MSVDIERLKQTVRLEIVGARRNQVSRLDVLKAVDGIVPVSEITAIFKQETSHVWFMSVSDSHNVNDLLRRNVLETECFNVRISSCAARRVTVKLHWLPVWLHDEPVMDFFSQFGKVVHMSRDFVDVGGAHVESGSRCVDLVITEGDQADIPYKCTIAGKSCLVTMPGRPPLCLKCGTLGHVRMDCKNARAFHPSRPVRPTYASVANSTPKPSSTVAIDNVNDSTETVKTQDVENVVIEQVKKRNNEDEEGFVEVVRKHRRTGKKILSLPLRVDMEFEDSGVIQPAQQFDDVDDCSMEDKDSHL